MRTGLLLAACLILAGCVGQPVTSGRPSAGGPAEAPSSDGRSFGAPQLAAGTDGWVLSREGLFEVAGGGAIAVPLSRPQSWISEAISVDDAGVVVAVQTSPESVVVLRSLDKGAAWTSSMPVTFPTLNGIADVSVAMIGSTIVVQANEATGSNASIGFVGTSLDSGKTWRVEPPADGGTVSAAGGAFWIVGGVKGDKISVSLDGLVWTPTSLPETAQEWTAAPVAGIDGSTAAVFTTSHTDADSVVTMWSSGDHGRTWRKGDSFTAPQTEFATTIPASVNPLGSWMAVWPDGSRIDVGKVALPGAAGIVSPNGLPGTIVALAQAADGSAIAEAVSSSCPNGKESCAEHARVLFSGDGGQTWGPLQ